MSEDETRAPADEQGVGADAKHRLATNVRISRKMRPFVWRMHLRLEHLDVADPEAFHRLDRAKQQIRKILKKKNVAVAAAEQAVKEALDAAVDYQAQALRAEQADQRNARAKEHLRRLMRHIEQLSNAVAKLPPLSKGKLNRIIIEQNWAEFDSEAFRQMFRKLLDSVSELSPRRFANDAGAAIQETLETRNDPVVAWYARQAPPALIELWEYLPDATRSAAEAALRGWIPPTRGQVLAFLAYLNSLLEKHWPKSDRRKRRALLGAYLNKLAAVWKRLNLDVGLARGGSREKKAESLFQQFARLALAGIGDNSIISLRQIANLKKARPAETQ